MYDYLNLMEAILESRVCDLEQGSKAHMEVKVIFPVTFQVELLYETFPTQGWTPAQHNRLMAQA